VLVHAGWRGQPQTGWNTTFNLLQQLAGGPEVTNVGHAGADEHFINFATLYFREQTGVVRIVWRTQDGLLDVGQVDLDNRSVFGVSIGGQQLGLRSEERRGGEGGWERR